MRVNRGPRQFKPPRCSGAQITEVCHRRIERFQMLSFRARGLTPFEHMRCDDQEPVPHKVGGKREMRVDSATRRRSIYLMTRKEFRKFFLPIVSCTRDITARRSA